MKKIILCASTALIFGTAFTQADTSFEIPLSGELPKACTVDGYLNGPFDALDMSSTASQGAESLSPICNYGGTLSVEFSSANNGAMVSGSNTVPYTLTISGGLLNAASLATPATVSNWPAAANAVQSRSMSVQLSSAATVAGSYSDTITATVTPN